MRNVLVTGASRGIGAAIAREFSKNGDKVFINYNTSREKAENLAKEINGTAVWADIADPDAVKEMLQKTGDIDVLVNNAGFAQFSMFDALSDEDWHRMIDVTLSGAFYCTRGVLPYMIHQKQGSIINISSIWGVTGASCEVAYSASKAGLIGFTKALAKELAPSGVTVNAVSPGLIDTKMNSHLSEDDIKTLCDEIPVGRMGKDEEVAHTVLFLASDGASYITAQNITVDGGWM